MKNLFCILFLSGLLVSQSFGQVFPYALSTYQEPYVPLSEALSATPTDDAGWDDPENGFYLIPIGFTFDLMGRSDEYVGVIDPGCQVIVGIMADTLNALSPYFADVMNANTKEVVSSIVYATEGTPGNRIFKLEWNNVGFYNEFDATGSFLSTSNYQVWFYESTNDIEFRFGPNSIDDGTLIHPEWGSPLLFFIKDFILEGQVTTTSWSLRGQPDNPTVDIIDLYVAPGLEEILLGEPSDSTVYHFDTGLVGVSEKESSPAFTVFPTVTSQSVATYWGKHEQTSLRVYDQIGNTVMHTTVNYGNNLFDVSNWSAGMYYFVAGEGPGMITEKVIKK